MESDRRCSCEDPPTQNPGVEQTRLVRVRNSGISVRTALWRNSRISPRMLDFAIGFDLSTVLKFTLVAGFQGFVTLTLGILGSPFIRVYIHRELSRNGNTLPMMTPAPLRRRQFSRMSGFRPSSIILDFQRPSSSRVATSFLCRNSCRATKARRL